MCLACQTVIGSLSSLKEMQMLQQEIAGEAERTGLTSEDDVIALVKELRNENEKE